VLLGVHVVDGLSVVLCVRLVSLLDIYKSDQKIYCRLKIGKRSFIQKNTLIILHSVRKCNLDNVA